MTIDLPSEQIRAATPAQFRALLREILHRSGLTSGQIAIKSGIPRSQAYALTSQARNNLPTIPDQVRGFVEACGVSPVQTGLVMKLWTELNDKARDDKARDAKAGALESLPVVLASGDVEATSRAIDTKDDVVVTGLNNVVLAVTDRRLRGGQRHRAPVRVGADSDFANLLFLILDSDERTHRAMRLIVLLLPVLLLLIVLLGGMVAWAVLQPRYGGPVSAGVLAMLVVAAGMAQRRRARRRRAPS